MDQVGVPHPAAVVVKHLIAELALQLQLGQRLVLRPQVDLQGVLGVGGKAAEVAYEFALPVEVLVQLELAGRNESYGGILK